MNSYARISQNRFIFTKCHLKYINLAYIIFLFYNKISNKNKIRIIYSNILQESMVGKSVWGPAIWYLFHTLAFKMKSENFNETKNSLLDFFVLISSNLPCPECTEHAQQETKNLDKSKITTKKELCTYFLNFHNKVNARTKKKIFTIQEYISKYKKAVTRNVISNFFINMTKSDHNVKLMINSFYKSNAVASLKKWIIQNSSKFNP